MTRYTYSPRAERIKARRQAAMDFLGAILFALCIAGPVALWWFGILGRAGT